MLKKLLALMFALFALAAHAAVDVNKASQAELDGIKGIGPSIAGKILDERKKGSFKDWQDFIDRVKGVGEGNAAKFSAGGLTVNGNSYKGAPATTAVAPAAAAAPAKEVSKEEKKAAAKKEKEEKAAAKKKEAEDKKAAKDAKDGKPAASAAKK